MTHFLVATSYHRPLPPATTSNCCSSDNFRPSSLNSIPSPNAGPAAFGYTLIGSRCQITTTTSRNRFVVCMATEKRVKMVAKQIFREISDMLVTDQVVRCAILPEARLGADRYLSSVTTISDVELSNDLQSAKVFVSVFGDERGKEVAIAGLQAKTRYVRGQLAKRMKLRLTPEIQFIEDDSVERGSRVIAILDQIDEEEKKKKKKKREKKRAEAKDAHDEDSDLLDDFVDDEDEEEEEEEEDEDEDKDDGGPKVDEDSDEDVIHVL